MKALLLCSVAFLTLSFSVANAERNVLERQVILADTCWPAGWAVGEYYWQCCSGSYHANGAGYVCN